MARVPDLKRLTTEDFDPEQSKLIKKIAFVVNSFHEQVRSALNKSIDFDNLDQQTITLSFLTGSDGQPLATQQFTSTLKNNIKGIIPISVKLQDNQGFVTQMPIINFLQNESLITIPYIGGLAPETNYTITLLII